MILCTQANCCQSVFMYGRLLCNSITLGSLVQINMSIIMSFINMLSCCDLTII